MGREKERDRLTQPSASNLFSLEMASASAPSILSTSTASSTPKHHHLAAASTSSALRLETKQQNVKQGYIRRRELLLKMGVTVPVLVSPLPCQGREVEVGSVLPPFPSDPSNFVLFKASPKDTPALRAGTLCLA